jgi:glycosyl transferase family 87
MRARFVAATAYGTAAVVVAFLLLRDAFATKIDAALRFGTGDCVINWLGARAWERGIDVYSPRGLAWAQLPSFGHPPTTPLWYLPFTAYGIFELNQVYGQLLLLLLLIHVVLVAAELRAPLPLLTALVAFALVCDTSFWANHVAMIQISEPIAFLYVLAWIFLRRDHEITSGVMIGLALTLKLYAGLLVVMLLVGRRWRGAIAAGVVYLVFAVAATWRFGFACWREFVAMLPATQNHWTGHIRNAGLQGIVQRWWYPACGDRGPVLGRATALATLLSLLLVAAIAWSTRRALLRKSPPVPVDDSVDLPFAMFSTASAWLNPVVWEHYAVTLILPIGVALFAAWRTRSRAWALGVTAVLIAVALMLGIDIHDKARLQEALPATHLRMHLYEVANWLPWPLTLTTLGALSWRRSNVAAGAPPGAAA